MNNGSEHSGRTAPATRGAELELHFARSPAEVRRDVLLLALIMALLASAYPALRTAAYQGSRELHAAIEMTGALLGLLAGAGFLIRFYNLGHRFYLFVGLAFFVNGAEDFVHGLIELATNHQWVDLPMKVVGHAIPATYVSGRLIAATLLILAPLLPARMSWPRNPRHETFWVSLIVLALSVVGTGLAFWAPLPQLTFPTSLIARPVDLVSAFLFGAALVLFLREYRRTCDRLTWWLALSIGVNLVGQTLMAFSQNLYDPFFDVAHAYKVLGYAAPLLGFLFHQTATICELRRTEGTLAREMERLRVTLGSIGDGVIATDVAGRILLINGVAERLTGWTDEAAVGQSLQAVFRIVNEQSGQPCEDPVARVLQTGLIVGLANHTVLVARDGAHRNIADSGAPIRDAEGRVIGVVLVFRDVTAAQQAEEAVRLNESRLEAVLRLHQMSRASLQEITDFTLEAAVSLTGSTLGYLAFLNDDESVLTMHAWSKAAMAQCAIIDKPIVYPVINTGLWGEAVRQRKPVITNDYQAPSPLKKGYPDGHVRVTRHMNAPIFDGERIVIVAGVGNKAAPYDDADVRQLTLLMQGMWQLLHHREAELALQKAHDELESRVRDRTADLARANAELEKARDAAEAASRAKSAFLANMSHEIRTPLNAIIGMTELVLKGSLAAQQREYLGTVRDSGEALLSVINDVLDFSKIEAGKLVLECDAFDLRESLGDTMKSFALRAYQQGLELACYIHPDVPHRVIGDYNRLRQVVVNLVGNAIKFTPQGEVTLEVTVEARCADCVTLHFTVTDTGIGIPADKRTKIFEMFEQADSSIRRRHGGSGLGLAIAARLVALMDGGLWVESAVGSGSRFHFTAALSLAPDEPAAPVPSEPVCLHGMPVLVVDDNATNRHILDEILRSWQMQPVVVSEAWEAIRALQQAVREGQPYRLMLTDAHMPGVDGFTLVEHIRGDPDTSSTVVIMLTSGDRPDDAVCCERLNIAAYLLKPVKQSELLEAIESALGVAAPVAPPAAPVEAAPPLRALRVLLAEDSPVNQKLAVAILSGQGHAVSLANNGLEAIAATAAERFDVVLMDVQMPELDGLEAAAAIRARERQTGQHVPIIAMTAHALKGDRQRCLAAGMDGYVAKPIRVEELFQAIDAVLRQRPAAAPTDDPPTAAPSADEPLDWTAALAGAQGDRGLLVSMAEALLQEAPRLLAAIRQSLVDGDPVRLRFAAHTLKGDLHCFCAGQACQCAAKLETFGLAAELAQAPAMLRNLESQMQRVTAALHAHMLKA